MAKFRKKPVVVEVEAQQFDPSKPRHEWPMGVEWESEFMDQDGSKLGGYYKLRLLGGFEFVNKGDWIIYGPKWSVMHDKEFRATYEPIDQATEACCGKGPYAD